MTGHCDERFLMLSMTRCFRIRLQCAIVSHICWINKRPTSYYFVSFGRRGEENIPFLQEHALTQHACSGVLHNVGQYAYCSPCCVHFRATCLENLFERLHLLIFCAICSQGTLE